MGNGKWEIGNSLIGNLLMFVKNIHPDSFSLVELVKKR